MQERDRVGQNEKPGYTQLPGGDTEQGIGSFCFISCQYCNVSESHLCCTFFSNLSRCFAMPCGALATSMRLLRELRNCFSNIICVRSLFCSVRVYVSHFPPNSFSKTKFLSFCVVFSCLYIIGFQFLDFLFCFEFNEEAVAQRCSVKKMFLEIS